MKTILYAHNGSGNHGCEALVRSTAQLLPGRPVLMTTAPEEDHRYGIDAVAEIFEDTTREISRHSAAYVAAAIQTKLTKQTTAFTKYARAGLLSHVEAGDVCLSIGGDNYCYAGTEILGDLNRLMQAKGVKTVLWGCSIDPESITPAMAEDLKRYDLITVREPLTRKALEAAGVTQNVRIVADSAFLLTPEQTALPCGFVPGNTVGLNISPLIFRYTDRKEDALSGFYALAQHILDTTDSAVALIPHVVKPGNDDREVLEPVFEKFRETGRVFLVPDCNCMQLKYIISQCRLFIGARTHATIAAYSTCVPTLVVGYSVKSRGIASDLFGTDQNYVLPIQQIRAPEDLICAYQWLENNADSMRQQLQDHIPAYREKAKLARQYFEELTK